MSTPDYTISARIVAEDATTAGAKSAERSIKAVEDRATSAGFSIGRMFAIIGGATGLGYAIRGMVGLNSEIQDATIGMASLLNASTGTPMDRSIRIARSQLQGLREDAAKGAGELTDYTQGFQVLLNPGLTAGKTLDQIRLLNKNAIGAGFALRGVEGIQYAPRDVQQALTGQLGERTTPIVFQALRAAHIDIEKFRRESVSKKFDDLNTAFGKFGPGIEAMGKTWSAQFATLKDNVKEVIRAVTGPLFDRWTKDLIKVNDWLKANKGHIAEIAETWGKRLVAMWDVLIKRAGTYAAIVGASALIPSANGAISSASAAMPAATKFLGTVGSAIRTGAMGGVASAGIAGSGWFGASMSGIAGGASAGLSAIGAALGPIAAVAGVVVAGILAIKGALSEFPSVGASVTGAVGDLMDAFGGLGGAMADLTAEGSALNLVGGAILEVFTGLIHVLAFGVRVIASVVEIVATLLRVIGDGAMGIYDVIMGNTARAQSRSVSGRLGEAGTALAGIWGVEPQGPALSKFGVRRREKGIEGLNTSSNVTNINGPITMHVKTEVNADPARVMVALNEGVDRLRVFATQGKRLPVLGV